MGLDLKAYLSRYYEIFGKRPEDFAAIEKRFVPHREGRKPLTPDDVIWLLHRDNAPFGNYWPEPNKKILDQLSRKPLRLDLRSQDKQDKEDVVKGLLGVLHDIGVTSIILRFVHPDSFGVFSSPVHALLLVNRMSALELYLAYCDELIAYKEKFKLSSVAQVEMALTALHEVMKGEHDEAARRAKAEFREDVWVQSQRVRRVVDAFLRTFKESSLRDLGLARILVNQDARIAGMIAGVEFERLLRRFCHQKYDDDFNVRKLIRDLQIPRSDKGKLHAVWGTRNKAMHPSGSAPTSQEVKDMIDNIEKICGDWNSI